MKESIPMIKVEFKPGTQFWFGTGTTPWQVLEVDRENEKALLIAEEPVCTREYHDRAEDITWELCSLRAWLNGDYYDKTFSEEEKAAILPSELKNQDNPRYGTRGGNDTRDNVFLLSIDEVKQFFQHESNRTAGIMWWLRTPGKSGAAVSTVSTEGMILDAGSNTIVRYGVRPAVKINLRSSYFQSLILSESSEAIIVRIQALYIQDGRVFNALREIVEVSIPESVTSIEEKCFAGCSKLRQVILPTSLTQIGKEAFSGCSGLTSITIPENVMTCVALNFAEPYTAPYWTWRGQLDVKGYRRVALLRYQKSVQTEKLAALLDHNSLMGILREWQKRDDPKWYAPYAAFANDEELRALISEMKTWEKEKTLRDQIIRVRGAILLNDTITAMRYADSLGYLEHYAKMREMDADMIRDNIISDFGLDECGKKTWVSGGKKLTVCLNQNLTLTLSDENGMILKSIPKKGIVPEEYDAVNEEFNAMKKDIKLTAKTRNDKIFEGFLSGRTRSGEAWKNAYLKKPLLRILASLIVWEQSGNTFILDENGDPIDEMCRAYVLTDEPIRVAHPLEMPKKTIKAWQQYFTSHSLKQPFEQIWEPVEDPALVKRGRYDGCTIPLYMLMNKEKHGIIMEGKSEITLIDCSADLRFVEGHHDWYNNEFEIRNFRFKKYTRQVNHIVVHLDKGTVAGRIKKDDISTVQWFDRFTLAQITEFIRLAQENNAVNVLAQLLEYKNEHFAEFDPMDEFTLELI